MYAKVIYKPDESVQEYMMIVQDVEMLKEWKAGDKTIPISEILDSFTIYHGPRDGILGSANKAQLDEVFRTHLNTEVAKIMLQEGIVVEVEVSTIVLLRCKLKDTS